MQHAIKKAVIPAAGFGTRLLPATKAQPKEMLVIVDKPVIQYVVEEAVQSGITDVLIIISDGKEVLRDHFKPDTALEQLLEQKGKGEELAAIRNLNHLCNIHITYQHEQKGLGDAILCAETFVGTDPFAVLLGDTIIESETPLTGQLALDYERLQQPVVALQQVPFSIAHRYGVLVGQPVADRLYKATALVEKPAEDNIPSNLVFSGRYVLTADIFDCIRNTPAGVNNEIQLTDAMRLLMQQRDLYGHLFDGVRHDVGNKLDFIKTNLLLGLNREDTGPELRKWLNSLLHNG
ncbi:MAG TPA: UTP--glucose-1-phosphate uridylyltransferase [Chitinophagales bacterium]|nr:UTP--glucose-1-phosphate uridylyltransferase [Chitinophagales bacterium]